MTGDRKGARPGLAVRLVSGVLVNGLLFGILWPPLSWLLGDSRGFTADLGQGIALGAIFGVLMVFVGEPLAGWLDGVLRRGRGGDRGGPGG